MKTKLLTVAGLKDRIETRQLENAVRDYIAENPWLISAEWETFRKERSVDNLLKDAAVEAKLDDDDDWAGRVDLALASGNHLLVLEFMRPGLKLDTDHLTRFELYVRAIRVNVEANTAGPFKQVTGYLIADALDGNAIFMSKLRSLASEAMLAMDWATLFGRAAASWQELLEIVALRAPSDDRLRSLLEPGSAGSQPTIDTVDG